MKTNQRAYWYDEKNIVEALTWLDSPATATAYLLKWMACDVGGMAYNHFPKHIGIDPQTLPLVARHE